MPESNASTGEGNVSLRVLLHQLEQARLFRHIPLRIPGAVVRQHSHAAAVPPSRKAARPSWWSDVRPQRNRTSQGRNTRRAFRLPSAGAIPPRLRVPRQRPPESRHALPPASSVLCSRLLVKATPSMRMESPAISRALCLPRIKPRPAVFRVPVARPIRQFASPALELPAARIAQQPHILLLAARPHQAACRPVRSLRLPGAWNRLHGLELAAFHKEIEETRMRFQPAMLAPSSPAPPIPAASTSKAARCVAPSMAVLPACTIFAGVEAGHKPDAL